jgi:hypothetical protein
MSSQDKMYSFISHFTLLEVRKIASLLGSYFTGQKGQKQPWATAYGSGAKTAGTGKGCQRSRLKMYIKSCHFLQVLWVTLCPFDKFKLLIKTYKARKTWPVHQACSHGRHRLSPLHRKSSFLLPAICFGPSFISNSPFKSQALILSPWCFNLNWRTFVSLCT